MSGGRVGAKDKKKSLTSRDAEVARVMSRADIVRRLIPWLGVAALVYLSQYPLETMQPMVEDLAGKRTNVSATFSVSIAINLFLGGTYFVQRRKLKAQQEELIRLRARLEAIDEQRIPKGKGQSR